MKNIRIKHLITLVTGALILVTVAVGGLGYFSARQSVDLLENVALRSSSQQTALATIAYRMETNRSQLLQALQHNPESKYAVMHDHPLANHFNNILANTAELRKAHGALVASLRRPEIKDALGRWESASAGFGIDMIARATRALEQGDWDLAQGILIREVNPTYLKGQQAYSAMQEFISARNLRQSEELHERLDLLNWLTIGAMAFAVLLAAAATVYLVRAITRPLDAAVQVARRVADGDLGARITVDSRNEFGQLLAALRDMTASLSGIVGEVRSGSDLIATASSQIAIGNMDLSARTEQQASSIEETAASVEELTGTVRQNADNARQANGLAANASSVATRGGAVVAEVVDTMGAINASARKIVDIIAVIDGIAFQTNILALNAAVEAARAGEQGRGFAVVASEVRSLAQRSANAAKEIKALITDSVEKVDSGSLLVGQAGATMEEIVQSVRKVAAIMEAITAASSEQSAGIDQIHQAISQMDRVTQQNAALVEEAAGAAQSLEESAASLAQRVSVFRTGDEQPARRPALAGHDAARIAWSAA
ncbi:methyl-accepting chemotaxis protein [uncultured Massilia sp.]|uniref:methyl-accepting chemotaxis protein n=1 Tax=uncultured Massilia sp. TaxID=169973 RepID=UPI0025903416|nr:methyl-accepting chemotaxis protein [uncultured Massilia sp.]